MQETLKSRLEPVKERLGYYSLSADGIRQVPMASGGSDVLCYGNEPRDKAWPNIMQLATHFLVLDGVISFCTIKHRQER